MSDYKYLDADSAFRARTVVLTGHAIPNTVLENAALPQVYMTLGDWERIFALIREVGPHLCNDVRWVLLRELNRAMVCSSHTIPQNVTINSCVRFQRHIGQACETRTLVCAPIDSGDATLTKMVVSSPHRGEQLFWVSPLDVKCLTHDGTACLARSSWKRSSTNGKPTAATCSRPTKDGPLAGPASAKGPIEHSIIIVMLSRRTYGPGRDRWAKKAARIRIRQSHEILASARVAAARPMRLGAALLMAANTHSQAPGRRVSFD